MNVYGHVTLDDKRAALDRFGDLLTQESEVMLLLSSAGCQRQP